MNTKILNTKIQEFIRERSEKKGDLHTFILGKNPFPQVPIQLLAQQINGRQKALQKFPTWAAHRDIYYPPNSNLEQTSSEHTAQYKSQLVSGKLLLDVTGGFGIDTYYFAQQMQQVIHCELNAELSTIVQHNFGVLGIQNTKCETGDGLVILEQGNWQKEGQPLDWIYLDPSRRHERKGKVFFLEDCLPNVPKYLELLFQKSANILIKTAPLLDITSGLRSLSNVAEIHSVAVQNEVKELLWVLQRGYLDVPKLHAINIKPQHTDRFSFTLPEEQHAIPNYGSPQRYLYEPNAALLKSGGFHSISIQFQLDKLHPNTHLYTANQKIEFPGRVFEVQQVIPYHKKAMQQLRMTKANITTRNFKESVATLRKKFKLKDGGKAYLFFTTLEDGQRVIMHCHKV